MMVVHLPAGKCTDTSLYELLILLSLPVGPRVLVATEHASIVTQ